MIKPIQYKKTLSLSGAVLLSNILTLPVNAADSFQEMFSEGKAYADINSRYEYVDEDNTKKNAKAGTVRARIGYDTGNYNGFSGKVEFSHNTDIFGLDEYNSKQNNKTQYSVVADPDLTRVNQAYLDYTGFDNTLIRYGRQRIKLDQDRFIGNVGWRQNEQVYDAFLVTNESLADTKITYGYIDKVQTFLDTRIDHSTHILNAQYKGFKLGSITGYYYGLENKDNQAQSSDTYGLQFKGNTAINDELKALYLAEYANQDESDDNPNDFDLDYYHLKGGMDFSSFNVNLGYEVLEGDGTNAFQTPLATKHAWNGWADKFLTTPADGLEDKYLAFATKFYGIKMKAVYHDYDSDKGSTSYGDEIDVVFTKKFKKNYTVLVKYANYDADKYSVDTEKFWIGFNAKFSQ